MTTSSLGDRQHFLSRGIIRDVNANELTFLKARDDFTRARRKAALMQAFATLTGKQIKLLPYDEIRAKLKFAGSTHRGVQEIPLKAIIGSVGRVQDFTRSFLPTNPSDEARWSSMRAYMQTNEIPPIEVYKLGDAYFVVDGNHRVSVSRELHREYISAIVTEVKTRVPLSHHDTPQQLICKAFYAEFLEQTNLDQLRPEYNLLMTFCDQYDLLLSQIEVNRYFMWQSSGEESPYPEVVIDWFDHAYLPVLQVIRQERLVQVFNERTETDLYILLTSHRLELEKQLGLKIDPPAVAASLARSRDRLGNLFSRLLKKLNR